MSEITYTKPRMQCPNCRELTVCVAINLSDIGEKSEQLLRLNNYDDIVFFRRGRFCTGCKEAFKTVELHERLLDELILFRGRKELLLQKLNEIVKQVNDIRKQSTTITKNIRNLSETIEDEGMLELGESLKSIFEELGFLNLKHDIFPSHND